MTQATGTEGRVCEFIAERQAFGLAKYGVSVENNPLGAADWLQHFKEELADALIYVARLQEEVALMGALCEQKGDAV